MDQGLDLTLFKSRQVLGNVLDLSEGSGEESRLLGLFSNCLRGSRGDSTLLSALGSTAGLLAPATGLLAFAGSAFGFGSSSFWLAPFDFDELVGDVIVVREGKRVRLVQDGHGVAGRGQATHDESDPHCLDKVLKLYSD